MPLSGEKMPLRAAIFHFVNGLSRRQKRAIFLTVDMVLGPLIAGFVLSPWATLTPWQLWLFMPILMAVSAGASLFMRLPRVKLKAYEIHAVVATAKFATLTTLGFAVLCLGSGQPYSMLDLVEFFLLLLGATVASRFVMLFWLRRVLRNGQQRCRVLIYGAGDTGLHMLAALRNLPHIHTVAFLDDNPDLQALSLGGLPVLSPTRLAGIVEKQRIDRVYLAMPSLPPRKVQTISIWLQEFGVDVQSMPSFCQLSGHDLKPRLHFATPARVFLGRNVVGDDIVEDNFAYRGRVVLVSGAGGSVGSELCRQLLTHRPRRLVLYERSEFALYTIERSLRDLCPDPDVEIVPVLASVTDALQARSTMFDLAVEVVFHAAAYKHVPLVEANPVAGLANNVIGTRVFAEAAVGAGVARFVLISTDKAVRPTSVMGGSKRLAELLVQDMAKRSQKTEFSIVRFGNVLGSSGSVLPRFREQIAQGGPVTLTDDNVTRYFMTLPEAARLVLVAGAFSGKEDPRQASVFVLDMGQPVRIRHLAERLIATAGLSLRDAANPDGDIEIIVTGLRPGEKMHEELFIENQFLPTSHPKILRAHERCLSEFAIASALQSTQLALAAGDQVAARLVLQTWVEGFPKTRENPARLVKSGGAN